MKDGLVGKGVTHDVTINKEVCKKTAQKNVIRLRNVSDERYTKNKAHSAMYASVGVLAGDDGVSRLHQQFHALVDAVLASVGDQDVARQLRRPVRFRLKRTQL